ncbi:glycosyltransferase family 2 protein [Limosilactobacillus vaginalis]|nr:glycosyltransferase family 2 protein [Limosilactobacillus vaginalis]QFS34262.1 glycosyltransferase family 2 protein [Limosilactobacillus vaginalis]
MTLPQRNTALERPTNFYYLMCKLDRAQYHLVEDGSLIIKNAWDHYKNMGIGSIIMEHGKNGINDPMLKIKVSGHIDYRYYYMLKRRITGDYADVFVTSCVNNFRFPVFKNEKFMSEQPLYYWFSQRYKSVFISKVLTVGNYLDDGLSRNLRKLEVENWKCTLYESNLFLSSDTPLWYRLKKGMLVDFILIKKKKSIFKYICKSSNRWILMTALLPAAMYTYFKR